MTSIFSSLMGVMWDSDYLNLQGGIKVIFTIMQIVVGILFPHAP
jgi:hypothetical protein